MFRWLGRAAMVSNLPDLQLTAKSWKGQIKEINQEAKTPAEIDRSGFRSRRRQPNE
jgi:hypothetical protein